MEERGSVERPRARLLLGVGGGIHVGELDGDAACLRCVRQGHMDMS